LKAVSRAGLGLLGVALIALILLDRPVRVMHNPVCGLQRWSFPNPEDDYDEFGIGERWAKAHEVPCPDVWLPGPLSKETAWAEGWSELQFLIASEHSIDGILAAVRAAPDEVLRRPDPYGRTLAHWAVVYPREDGRRLLLELLQQRGIDFDERDADGLSPRDWQRRAGS